MNNTTLWGPTIEDYRGWMMAAAMSEQTIYLRCYQLTRLGKAYPAGPWTVTDRDLVGWFARQAWSAGTVRSWRSAIGSFYKWAVITGRISSSPAAVMPPVPPVHLKARPAPDPVITEALATADRRTGLMVRLARRAGLRRGEIARAHYADLLGEPDGWWLIVHGKGAKDRLVPLDDETASAIRAWMGVRRGWLFPGTIGGHLAPATVGRLVTRHLTGPWTTHTLRHRYATVAYQGSHDLLAVQKLLGHSKPETTQIYVEVDREALRAAASWAA